MAWALLASSEEATAVPAPWEEGSQVPPGSSTCPDWWSHPLSVPKPFPLPSVETWWP